MSILSTSHQKETFSSFCRFPGSLHHCTRLCLFRFLFIVGALADRYGIHSQLSGSLTVVTTFIQVLLLFVPNVIHERVNIVQDCSMTNATTFSSNATSFSENGTFFPVDVSANGMTTCTSFCLLEYRDGQPSFSLNCDASQQIVEESLPNETLLLHSENALDVRWNCSMFPNDTTSVAEQNLSSCTNHEILITQAMTFQNTCSLDVNSVQDFVIFDNCEDTTMRFFCRQLATNVSATAHKNFGLTFWVYFCIYGLASFLMNPIFPLLNSIAYALLGNERNSWGKQRLWGKNFSSLPHN